MMTGWPGLPLFTSVLNSAAMVGPRSVTLTVGDATTPVLARSTFDPLAPPDLLELSDPYGRPAGVLVSDATRLAVFQTWPLQEHRFAATATEFAASCVTPMPAVGVRGFTTPDGTLFTGEVWLVEIGRASCRERVSSPV